MKKILLFVVAVGVVSATLSVGFAEASSPYDGKIVKRKGDESIYYVSSDGARHVFPNGKVYFSWFSDFSGVVELDDSQLMNLPLGGNVVYRPGVVLVKIQTDPKVYAVSQNGQLRWVKTEQLAKKLYGDKWNLLVDDIPDSFFVNYVVSTAIESDDDFDPEEEEKNVRSIDENRMAKQARKVVKEKLNFCEKSQKQLNKIQERLARRGVTITGIGDDFIQQCVAQVTPSPKKEKGKKEDDDDDKKVVICHNPPGNPAGRHTLVVGVPAAKAHLSHGDALGRCDRDQTDTKSPVITLVAATSIASTAAQITWITNELATSKVTYATTNLAVASSTQSVSSVALITAHALGLTGLTPSTQYFFRVESADAAGNTATSTAMTFTTPSGVLDTTAPVISGIATSAATSTASVTWVTNEAAKSEVTYSTQPLAVATATQMVSSAGLVTTHALNLSSLTPSTVYYYRVKSTDASANAATSTEKTFTTQVWPAADVTPPILSSIIATASSTSALIGWATNEAATSEVIYTTQPLATATTTQSVVNLGLVTSHSLNALSLTASTTYYFLVTSADAAGNSVTSTQHSFVTAAP